MGNKVQTLTVKGQATASQAFDTYLKAYYCFRKKRKNVWKSESITKNFSATIKMVPEDDVEDFLQEIEEYALKLKESKTCDDSEVTENSDLEDSNS